MSEADGALRLVVDSRTVLKAIYSEREGGVGIEVDGSGNLQDLSLNPTFPVPGGSDTFSTFGPPVTNDDESFDTLTSKVTFDASAGQVYHIAVGGYAGEFGSIVLNWGPD